MFICFVLFMFIVETVVSASIPPYIHVCQRDQETINECVRESIEYLRPKLAEGIPELRVPSLEPLTIPELVVDQGNVVLFKAVGRDVKVYGASNFKLKRLELDLENLLIKVNVFLPRLEFRGKYDLDARLLVLPIHGKGDIIANATNCLADVILQGELEHRNGLEYLKFSSVSMDIDVGDYSIKLTNLFNGDEILGQIANEAINSNRAEFLKAMKPYVERTASNLFKKIGNRIVDAFKFDDILPLPE